MGRRGVLFLVVCAGLGWGAAAEAAPVGSRLAEEGRWSAGGEVNALLDREMSGNVEAESSQFLGTGMYGVTDRLSALMKLGAAGLDDTGVPDYDGTLAYGLGLRARLLDLGPWELIGSPQYFSIVDPDTNIGSTQVDGSWHEFQGSLVVARSFPLNAPAESAGARGQEIARPEQVIRPYAGLKVSGVEADRESTTAAGVTTETNLDADEHVGLVGGVEADLGRWALGLEGRALDEDAITVAASVDF